MQRFYRFSRTANTAYLHIMRFQFLQNQLEIQLHVAENYEISDRIFVASFATLFGVELKIILGGSS